MGPWAAVRKKAVEQWDWTLLTYGSGKNQSNTEIGLGSLDCGEKEYADYWDWALLTFG